VNNLVKKSATAFFSILSAGALLASIAVPAQAQFAPFKNTLGATGVASPDGTTISFPLFRQDLTSLTVKADGNGAIPAAPEAIANGYISIKTVGDNFFFTGAFPATDTELPKLEQALMAEGLPITAVVNQTAGLSQAVTTVHTEGTSTQTAKKLANHFLEVLATIGSNLQQNVTIQEIPN
jgi:hypothetical protein